ncbi:hypothetical protein [Chryseobacterium sp. G0240]|uniref:hypothetical protein n=1 Tax=Chryseobacterium sp. G0240 TaxID=2487066 RepID=UPI0011CEBE27|nr:hypothetical protein [Chryseobacterium sp. G0240]
MVVMQSTFVIPQQSTHSNYATRFDSVYFDAKESFYRTTMFECIIYGCDAKHLRHSVGIQP